MDHHLADHLQPLDGNGVLTMSLTRTPLLLVAFALAVAGCGSSTPSTVDASVSDATPTNDLVPASPPEGLAPQGGEPMFSLDTTTPTLEVAIEGDMQHRLQGVLADALGRRALRYTLDASRSELVADAGWNLPPAAAVRLGGDTMVCFNTLTGVPSSNTRGAMPDPTLGMEVRCRLRTTAGWGPTETLATTTRGAWVQRVVATPEGFRVLLYGDEGWMLAPAGPQHGVYDATWTNGHWSDVRFVMAAPRE